MAIIGTVRPEEAKVFDSHEGFHKFHADETQEPHGSFQVFWDDSDIPFGNDPQNARNYDSAGDPVKPGWYWWSCFPGCLPDGDPFGPFASSRQAHEDADEWSPEYDD
mgnify:FL=1